MITFLVLGKAPVAKKARSPLQPSTSQDDGNYIPASGQYLISLKFEDVFHSMYAPEIGGLLYVLALYLMGMIHC
jgi:hypothetical protein